MAKRLLRRALSAPGLLREVRACFEEMDDPVRGREFCLAECLMSGLAVFGLKYPSLRQFDRDARTDELVRANLRRLCGIEPAPCDTALRERLAAWRRSCASTPGCSGSSRRTRRRRWRSAASRTRRRRSMYRYSEKRSGTSGTKAKNRDCEFDPREI